MGARHLSTGEFVLVGALVTLVGALFLLLLGGGFDALRARLEATPLPQTRDSVVAEMREIIRVSRETAEQLRAVPALIVGSAGGLDCADLPSIPATYRLPDSERTAYPELGPAEGALHEARIALHDVEARWQHECQDGRLREAQAHILTQTEAFIQAGLAALAEAERVLDLLPPLPTVTPTGVSWYTNRDG
ncbi:MAG: hypothetical protein M5R36_10185 [Deltaproteobacteria bacterium]|nr:hypothetical protein [Deltaproteobacteria bacterium]